MFRAGKMTTLFTGYGSGFDPCSVHGAAETGLGGLTVETAQLLGYHFASSRKAATMATFKSKLQNCLGLI